MSVNIDIHNNKTNSYYSLHIIKIAFNENHIANFQGKK